MEPAKEKQEIIISKYIIAYKFILGLIELLLGLGIVFFGDSVYDLYHDIRIKELLEDEHDLIIQASVKVLPFILENKGWVIMFLLLLGISKIIGAVGMYYRKHWGLDLLVGLTIILLPFDVYGAFNHPTILKILFLVANIFIALFLVQFKPRAYFTDMKQRFKR